MEISCCFFIRVLSILRLWCQQGSTWTERRLNAVLRHAQISLGLFVISCSSMAYVSVGSVILGVWILGLLCYLIPLGSQVLLGCLNSDVQGRDWYMLSVPSVFPSVCLSICLVSIIYHLSVIYHLSTSFILSVSIHLFTHKSVCLS